jgi:predicted negative regulator of RcsB-dependent stress response
MWAAFAEYWYLTAALVAVSVLTAFVCFKAFKAVQKTNRERKKTIETLTYLKEVRAQFAAPTHEQIHDADARRLIDGIALNIQAALEKHEDINAAYEALPEPARFVYALYYFELDSVEKLSEFFRRNGKPLTVHAQAAVETVLGCKVSELYNLECAAFDEDDEITSLIPADIRRADDDFAAVARRRRFAHALPGNSARTPRFFVK